MAVATADWNSAMNGTGAYGGGRRERVRRGARKNPSARTTSGIVSSADRALLSAACVREVAGSTAGETLTPERTVLLDTEAAAKVFLVLALFFQLLSR